AWNLAVGTACESLKLDYHVSVGLDMAASPSTQPPDSMVEGCKKLYLVKTGDGCWAIANDNDIELRDFYVWNPAVSNGGECAVLWPDVYVCVGV
ncbi:carbohydrate-binding module family 50 protein, partial [Trichocladium antarcticum]